MVRSRNKAQERGRHLIGCMGTEYGAEANGPREGHLPACHRLGGEHSVPTMRLAFVYGAGREKTDPGFFPHLPGPRVIKEPGKWAQLIFSSLKSHLSSLKSSPFSRCLQPRWCDICQWGKGRPGSPLTWRRGGHVGSRAREILNVAWVPTSQWWRETTVVWPLSPSLLQFCRTKSLKSASWLGFLGCRLQGPLEWCLGNLNSYIGYRQAKVAMETLHPFLDLQPLLPPRMLHPQPPHHTGAGGPHRAR